MRIGIILSGGVGTRVGTDIPKQYIEVCGRPLISYCLEAIAQGVDRLQIVAAPEWRDFIISECAGISDRLAMRMKSTSALEKVEFSEPGLTRQFSIYNALKDIEKFAAPRDAVIIHDAARPFVTTELVERCFTAIEKEGHEGVLPVLPVKDTIYFSMDGMAITSLLDRTKLFAGQAPEAFLFKRYLDANERLITRTWEAGGEYIIAPTSDIFKVNGSTEPAKLAGMDVVLIEGEERNYKVTTPEDLVRCREDISNIL